MWLVHGTLTVDTLGSRSGVGTHPADGVEAAKAAETDAFKRAALKFGVGLHLYEDDASGTPPQQQPAATASPPPLAKRREWQWQRQKWRLWQWKREWLWKRKRRLRKQPTRTQPFRTPKPRSKRCGPQRSVLKGSKTRLEGSLYPLMSTRKTTKSIGKKQARRFIRHGDFRYERRKQPRGFA